MNIGRVAIEHICEKLANIEFINKHKKHVTNFTRNRICTFTYLFLLILRNSVKSIQLVLNELFIQGLQKSMSASAYTQARKKLKHTAFKELNEDIVNIYYTHHEQLKKWTNYRCFGFDGSKIVLPRTPEIEQTFGTVKIKNQNMEDHYTCATLGCCYDVLNRIAYKTILAPAYSYEVDLAQEILPAIGTTDLMLFDRNFAAYGFLASLVQNGNKFVIRCSRSSFKATQCLFDKPVGQSTEVTLHATKDNRKEIHEQGLPQEIQVRFVSVILPTGAIEVLVTNLMDPTLTSEDFAQLYHLRWGVETFFGVLKGRLCLENFTGKSLESVLQDFWSALFISNFESILIESEEEKMNVQLKEGQLHKKINKAVSFNALKNMAFEIFAHPQNLDQALEKLTTIFRTNTIVQRDNRSPPRKLFSPYRSFTFSKRFKKQVF